MSGIKIFYLPFLIISHKATILASFLHLNSSTLSPVSPKLITSSFLASIVTNIPICIEQGLPISEELQALNGF